MGFRCIVYRCRGRILVDRSLSVMGAAVLVITSSKVFPRTRSMGSSKCCEVSSDELSRPSHGVGLLRTSEFIQAHPDSRISHGVHLLMNGIYTKHQQSVVQRGEKQDTRPFGYPAKSLQGGQFSSLPRVSTPPQEINSSNRVVFGL